MSVSTEFRHRLEYMAVWIPYHLIRHLPYCVVKFIARCGGCLVHAAPSARRIVRANIHAAMPELPESEVNRIARESFYHIAWNLLEFFWLDGKPARIRRCYYLPEEITEQLKGHVARGERIIFVNPHLGSWEASGVMAPFYAGVRMVAIAKPVKNPYLARLLQPDKRLPVPFSLRRYHTKSLGFFQIAAYGNETGLLAERDFNTLKSAAPNRRMLKGFGEQAFISFLPAPEPPKPFDLETAQGEFTFSDLEPEGEPQFEQLNPGLIKSSRAPSFQKIGVVEELPANFEDELRRQLAAAPYRGISLDTTSPDNSEPPSQPAPKAKATPPTPAPSLASAPEDAPDLNPFAVRTNFERSPQGMYVLVIYYPQQSLVCELAADTRFANLQSFLNIAILVQTRLKRW